jgi:acetyl-CoA acetyltransferase
MGVQILGAGLCGSFRTSSGMSYRELTARAARMAYKDAGISTEDLDGAVVAEEDFTSGYSICDEYTPDQLGVVRKAVYTVCGDFLQALGSAVMQIETGQYRLLAVSAFSKASNILTKDEVLNFAYDPAGRSCSAGRRSRHTQSIMCLRDEHRRQAGSPFPHAGVALDPAHGSHPRRWCRCCGRRQR